MGDQFDKWQQRFVDVLVPKLVASELERRKALRAEAAIDQRRAERTAFRDGAEWMLLTSEIVNREIIEREVERRYPMPRG